jgi:VWFA-related protein
MMKPFLLRATLLALLFCADSGLHSQAGKTEQDASDRQQSPEYVFRTTTRLVLLDLVATDGQGRTVTDLKPEEVEIYENGKEQSKRDFSFIHPDPEAAPQQAAPSLPPDVYTNVPQFKGNSSYNIILFDVLNTSFANLAYAHEELMKYLDKAPPNQPTAIYALGNKLWMLHDFTTDHQALKEVMRKFKGQGSQLVTAGPNGEADYKRKSTFSTAGADRVWTTLDSFRSLARVMSAYKGRKNLIWISESFVVDTMPDMAPPRGPIFMDEYSREVEEMSDAMMEAQIAIYPIDPVGLSGEAFRPMLSRFSSRSSLQEMAARTGGKAFTNRNDLDVGIQSSIDDGSSYYTTSYTPANKTWDGKLRKVEVKCTRSGVKLRYREGYYAVDPSVLPGTKKEVKQTSIDFAQALDPDLPVSTGLLFQARVSPPSEQTGGKVVVNFAVDPHTVAFEKNKEDGLEHAEVSCIAWAFPVKGKPIGSGGGTVNAKLNDEIFKKVMQSAMPCKQSLDLAPGNYMLRLGAIDQRSKRIGALTAWVTVPEKTEATIQAATGGSPTGVPPADAKKDTDKQK